MQELDLQKQINQLDKKMDVLLSIVTQQQQKTESVEDLLADLQIVGKDLYDTAVVELENQQVEIDIEEIKKIGVGLLHNIENMGVMLNMFESVVDFSKDAGPLVRESIIDLTKRLNEMEQKGYFEFFAEASRVVDNVIQAFSKEDVAQLADNIVTILNTVKSLTQPDMMKAFDNALKAYNSMEMETIPEYSIFKLIREINKPEMKKAMGFMVTFMKNISAK